MTHFNYFSPFLVVLEFELRASCLPGRHSATPAALPALHFITS
jgi:hypothetical protein